MKHTLLFICLLSFVPLESAPAKGAKSAKSVKVNASGAKITLVSGTSISVEMGKSTHTYKISGQTQIHLDGRKTSANDLRKGMRADVTASQLDPDTAIIIEASTGK